MAKEIFKTIPLNGKLITADDPTTIGTNFQTLKNLRYDTNNPKGVSGMTKINTTVLADAYKHIQNGFHFKKEQPAESHVLVQATSTSDANPVILENTTAIPSQGDFSGTVVYTENTAAGVARFSDAPNGQVAVCDGKEALIWGGDESRLAAFLTSTATIGASLTNPQDFTNEVQNTLTDKVASIGSGIDSDTVLMLHMDGSDGSTTFTDSSASPHTVTAVGNAQIDTDQAKFSQSGLFSSTSDYLTVPDHADFDFSGGVWTVDKWERLQFPAFDHTWTERSNPKNFDLQGIAWNGSIFVVVGEGDGTDAYIVTSPDGITWTERSNPKNVNLRGIAWNGSVFCAVGIIDGTDAYIVTSPDGITWTERSNPKNFTLWSIAWNGSIFVAVGDGDGADAYIITSPDGTTWTERSNPKDFDLYGIMWNGSIFVAVGLADGADAYIVTSPDGTTWTERANPKNVNLWGIAWNGSVFCAVGLIDGTDAYIVTSPDGITWTERSNPKNFTLWGGITWNGSIFVAVGNADGTDAYVITSPDGITWTERSNPKNFRLQGIAWNGSIFVAVGLADGADAYIITTPDHSFEIFSQQTNANNKIVLKAHWDKSVSFSVLNSGVGIVQMQTAKAVFSESTFFHCVVVENGNNYYIFINGVLKASTTDTGRPANYTGTFQISRSGSSSVKHGDEFRVSKSVARWTSDFTPPARAYQTTNLDFLVASTRPLKGVKFYIPSGGGNDDASATLTMKEWNGNSWTTISITDNTSGLESTGTVTWSSTVNTSKTRYLEGRFLYWYNFTISGGNCEIYQVTVDAPFQTIKDIWDGKLRTITSYKVYADSKYQDYSVNVVQDSYDSGNTATYVALDSGGLTSSEYQLIGFLERQTALKIHFFEDDVNAVASTLTVYYWNGVSWVSAGNIVDGTLEGSASFAKSGVISWQAPSSTEEFKTSITGEFPLYYYKLQQSATMTADVKLYYITGIPAQKEIKGHKFPFFADNCLWLFSEQSDRKNTIIKSKPNAPDVFNGDEFKEFPVGDEKELTAATALYTKIEEDVYDIKLIYKANAMFGLTGKTVEDYRIFNISSSIGCVAPLTLDTSVITTEENVYSIAIWQGANGIYIYNNVAPVLISEDIRNFFDENQSNTNKIHASYIANSVGFIDEEKMEYHWLFADGSSSGTLNREFVFDLRKFKWFEIPRGSGKELQCGFKVIDTNGYNYNYGCIDTGYMERLENGTDFDGTDITFTMQLGDFTPYVDESALAVVSQLLKHRLIMVAKSSAKAGGASQNITATHYGDGKTSGTNISTAISPLNSGYRIANVLTNTNQGDYTFHSLKYTITTDDEKHGFEPLAINLKFAIIGEKLE